ncbi:maleylpyruvate isomerase family mycothiol-dependent enzyme [Planomonospora sp. ID67723]|uniref:maleylpyruvate isomerase family mycothiol-dependent enzyme n=1 Tax=Planomonospora sp. ID67723 TaxID=2738134 RepID=UPI0018C35932|nr:maleylpyruvate isomerase family mycothiol-dependent enzyme [Planomonospora sp. ID67723]MBG0830451.1 maleylpyruvate isomerase family mycothiol-dependent enzyme [Planomonospora sp. ID67723]
MNEKSDILSHINPFDLFDTEAERLDRHFSRLGAEDWNRPSRCAGWSVRDVLAHLAGEEMYNHACLDDDIDGFFARLEHEGIQGGVAGFNDWCVRRRRNRPVEDVLAEWRQGNGETRRRMRALGRDALLPTSAGPYPVGLQAFHYASEYATHADDVGAPVGAGEFDRRIWWRAEVGVFALAEQHPEVQVEVTAERIWVCARGTSAQVPAPVFVEATVGRLPAGHPLDRMLDDGLDHELRAELRCLA